MASLSRFLLPMAATLALAGVAPAYAGNSQAPGALKKVTTTETQAPAAAPAPVAQPAPAPQVDTNSSPTAPVKAKGNAPVNKGTAKKVVQQAPATAPVAGAGTTTTRHRVRSRTNRTAAPHAAVRSHSGTTRTRRSGAGSTAETRSAARAQARAAAASSAAQAVAQEAVRAARHATARRHGAGPATPVKAKKAVSHAPLASVSRAADRVVEVIPGVVILALAGLAALVLLLIVRSWAMERTRAKALENSYRVTVEALATAIEAKDHTTGGHIERVRKLGLLLATEMAPREARDPQMAFGFLLHDIGKLAVPDAILRAPGRLEEDEWALMRRHPEEGVRMLANVPFLDKALDVVRYHHERWDGGGYPDGLRGEEIPLWARIFSVVDALDAMTAERPYRSPRSYESALEEIRLHAGKQFDPDVVDALERIDPARVQPLLEPAQLLEPQLAEVTQLAPLAAA